MTQFRGELATIYAQKENLIIKKYQVEKAVYAASLEKYRRDGQISRNVREIFDMLERAINGKVPDFTVPDEAMKTFNRDMLCDIYRDMVIKIGQKVSTKLREESLKNTDFNPSDDDDFRTAIRELSIYDVKVDFLISKGYKKEWGCPNEV